VSYSDEISFVPCEIAKEKKERGEKGLGPSLYRHAKRREKKRRKGGATLSMAKQRSTNLWMKEVRER